MIPRTRPKIVPDMRKYVPNHLPKPRNTFEKKKNEKQKNREKSRNSKKTKSKKFENAQKEFKSHMSGQKFKNLLKEIFFGGPRAPKINIWGPWALQNARFRKHVYF